MKLILCSHCVRGKYKRIIQTLKEAHARVIQSREVGNKCGKVVIRHEVQGYGRVVKGCYANNGRVAESVRETQQIGSQRIVVDNHIKLKVRRIVQQLLQALRCCYAFGSFQAVIIMNRNCHIIANANKRVDIEIVGASRIVKVVGTLQVYIADIGWDLIVRPWQVHRQYGQIVTPLSQLIQQYAIPAIENLPLVSRPCSIAAPTTCHM